MEILSLFFPITNLDLFLSKGKILVTSPLIFKPDFFDLYN